MLNHLLNVSWTVIGFSPVGYFWFYHGVDAVFIILLLISIVACFLPERVYRKLHVSKNLKAYKKLGVKTVRRFVQDGDFGATKPNSVKAYLKKISMFERYHYSCLIFFQASSVYACLNEQFLLALLIFLCNIIYNVCPLLLQQYNKLRIIKILKQR